MSTPHPIPISRVVRGQCPHSAIGNPRQTPSLPQHSSLGNPVKRPGKVSSPPSLCFLTCQTRSLNWMAPKPTSSQTFWSPWVSGLEL